MLRFLKRNAVPVSASAAVAVTFSLVGWRFISDGNVQGPSLGDWGDFIGGAMAVIAFIWLISAQHETQRQLVSANREMQIQAEATRSVVASLATMAAANRVQIGDLFADAQPIFVPLSVTPTVSNPGSFRIDQNSGYISVRNQGELATLLAVRAFQEHITAGLEGNRLCPNGSTFKIHIRSESLLKNAGPVTVLLEFDDKLQTRGWALFHANNMEQMPQVRQGRGQFEG